jgi:alkyldihydroxyacetonephosphate synthase
VSRVDSLRAALADGAVDTAPEALAAAGADCWPVSVKRLALGRQPTPLAVVRPSSVAELRTVLGWAISQDVRITVRGAGSAVTGAPVPGDGELVLETTRLDGTVEIDEANLLVTAGAGVLGGRLEHELRERGYTTGFSPQSLHRSTVGGWVSTRATGQLSSRYGAIEEAVVGLEVVLATGEIVSWRPLPRWSAGPDLRQLFLGAEGTLGVVTQATLRIHSLPEATAFASSAFPRLASGVDAIRRLAQSPLRPAIVRLYDPAEAAHLLGSNAGDESLLLLSFEGCADVVASELALAERICDELGGRSLGPDPVQQWVERRYDFRAVEQVLAASGGVAETIEVSALWSDALNVHQAMTKALADTADTVWGHFSHVYPQGTSLYVIVLAQRDDDLQALAALQTIWERAVEACRAAGGSIVHHHGIGLARLPWLAGELGGAHDLLRRVKRALDTTGVLAPGKLDC